MVEAFTNYALRLQAFNIAFDAKHLELLAALEMPEAAVIPVAGLMDFGDMMAHTVAQEQMQKQRLFQLETVKEDLEVLRDSYRKVRARQYEDSKTLRETAVKEIYGLFAKEPRRGWIFDHGADSYQLATFLSVKEAQRTPGDFVVKYMHQTSWSLATCEVGHNYKILPYLEGVPETVQRAIIAALHDTSSRLRVYFRTL